MRHSQSHSHLIEQTNMHDIDKADDETAFIAAMQRTSSFDFDADHDAASMHCCFVPPLLFNALQ